ncbi:SapC family protein [Thalassomonas haliotis]|uniref:SapC family protein n=1 Tax=Thalassomonas haliotis TaxID=485448 RepID=A0ABY7VAA6_9GAMM|nr:SapC family protein [Thalassomonas haliotis]WDE10230.1 SapC family protein [Thalassomonas haliotis]
MANLVAVDNQSHLTTRVDPDKSELHGQGQHLLPVVMSEFTQVGLQYPIVLTKKGDTGQFIFAAMLGFEAGENLFWQNETWQGVYLPLQIRRQPFFVEKSVEKRVQKNAGSDSDTGGEDGDYIVCMDTSSPTICFDVSAGICADSDSGDSSEKGLPLFDKTGRDSEYFLQVKECLSQLLTGELDNQKLLEHLQAMDLLQSMTLDITFENQQSRKITGLYTIDQQKLAKLTDEQVLTLHKSGLFAPIYTFIASQGQIHNLIDLKNKQLA